MTVSTEIISHSYFPGSAMLAEAIPFQYLAAADLTVSSSSGLPQVLGIDYSITGDGRTRAGRITALHVYASDILLTVERRTARIQQAVTDPFKPLPADDVGRELDRRAMVEQEIDGHVSNVQARALLVPPGEVSEELPVSSERAGRYLAFGPGGHPVAAEGTGADTALRVDLARPEGSQLAGFTHEVPGLPGSALAKMQQDAYVNDLPYGAIGVGTETAKVQKCIDENPGKPVRVRAGTEILVSGIYSPLRPIEGPGKLVKPAPWGGKKPLTSYTRTGQSVLGRSNLFRVKSRLQLQTSSAAFVVRSQLFGNSTGATAPRIVTGSITGTVLTVTDASLLNGAILTIGTLLTHEAIMPNTRIVGFGDGTGGVGTYIVNINQAVGLAFITAWNGGGYAGLLGEPNFLLAKRWKRRGVRMAIDIKNHMIGGSDLGDVNFVDFLDTDTGADDLMMCNHAINDAGGGLQLFFDRYKARLDALRSVGHGTVNNLAFVVIGPSPTADHEHGRSDYWMEDLRGGYEQLVEDYDICYLDVFQRFRGIDWSTGHLLDDAFGTGHSGVHQLLPLQVPIWSWIADQVVDEGEMMLIDDNALTPINYVPGWTSAASLDYAEPYFSMDRDGDGRFGGVVQGPAASDGAAIAQSPLWGPVTAVEPVVVASSQGPIMVRWNALNRNVELHGNNFTSPGWISLVGVRGPTR